MGSKGSVGREISKGVEKETRHSGVYKEGVGSLGKGKGRLVGGGRSYKRLIRTERRARSNHEVIFHHHSI